MREDLKKIIEDNWEDIKELMIEKLVAEQELKTIWDLNIEDGEIYNYISSCGEIGKSYFDSMYDENARDIGNAFLTREEAKFELERRKIEAIIRKYSRPFKYEERNHYIEYQYDRDMLVISVYHYINMGIPYFESAEIAQKVIEEIGGDRLKKYWFGIEE